ncbi:MAG: Fe-S cluster assembly ATPase SufC [Deltaproteobacteria bacterium]|nr:MAG: Fe-S cluster assembly ATPase SufC [Deltaproteobacteria bacterium]
MTTPLLELKNVHASVAGTPILKGVNLVVNPGEVHAIMGPNGAGKSTLSKLITGHPDYELTEGQILYKGEDIAEMEPDERARAGIFMSFQYPVEIPGVSTSFFLKAAVNASRRERGEPELDAMDFLKVARTKMKQVGMPGDLLHRAVNEGFSGGEKKKNEIFQMAMLEPTLAVLDETDSGLDVDALRTISEGVNAMRNDERGMVVITHYQRLLDHIVPDFTHILAGGKIVKSGGADLAKQVEASGYEGLA